VFFHKPSTSFGFMVLPIFIITLRHNVIHIDFPFYALIYLTLQFVKRFSSTLPVGARKILQTTEAKEIKKFYRSFLSMQIMFVEIDKLDWSTDKIPPWLSGKTEYLLTNFVLPNNK